MLTLTCLINHPTLGPIRGIPSPSSPTVQFRNLKYASIPGRWLDPILYSHNDHVRDINRQDEREFDATRFGPMCPQKAGGLEFDLKLVGDVRLEHDTGGESELECLNLVVTVQQIGGFDRGSGLPVMVWVHGGGFSVGGNSFPQYNLEKLVKASIEIGKPVIGVSINYRLGILGFLASDELGINGNYGFKDQACAFKWIKTHIAGFGGDPNRIMAFGESAGAISLSTHLLRDEPLFSRAVIMSGDSTLRRIRKRSWHNALYEKNLEMLGLTNLSPTERKHKLHEMSAAEMMRRLPLFQHWSPSIDGRYLTKEVDLGMLSNVNDPTGKPQWCREIAIGSTLNDGTVLKFSVMDDPTAMNRLHKALNLLLSTTERENLLAAYNLTTFSSPVELKEGLLALITELRFHLPVLKNVEGWEDKANDNNCEAREGVYKYHFHQPNPFDGYFKGLASHELDVAFILQNFEQHMDVENHKVAIGMARVWITFAYGLGWPRGEAGEKVLVIGGGDVITSVDDEHYDLKFRKGRGRLLLDIGWKRCFKLGEMLQGCYSEDEDEDVESRSKSHL